VIDFEAERGRRQIDHGACQARETEAWRCALAEVGKRHNAEQWLRFWRNLAVFWIIFDVGWWWFS
jgi:hypothetical protein